MMEIAEDPEVGANFVALVIVRLRDGDLVGSASVFLPDGVYEEARLSLEGAGG
jgi:hypothetical protein